MTIAKTRHTLQNIFLPNIFLLVYFLVFTFKRALNLDWIDYNMIFSSFFCWNCSKFGDIFDEDFFIYALKNHVNVVRELPEDILQRFDNNISKIVNLRVKGWSSPTYYLQKVLPKLVQMGYEIFVSFNSEYVNKFTTVIIIN